jgi:sporulation protein YlmC with PRC-barrel domain
VLLQTILYVEVVDANGKRLGRVSDVVAERRGEDLCVTHLIVGARGWIGRFGPFGKNEGRHIPWEQISELGSPIRLRRGRT